MDVCAYLILFNAEDKGKFCAQELLRIPQKVLIAQVKFPSQRQLGIFMGMQRADHCYQSCPITAADQLPVALLAQVFLRDPGTAVCVLQAEHFVQFLTGQDRAELCHCGRLLGGDIVSCTGLIQRLQYIVLDLLAVNVLDLQIQNQANTMRTVNNLLSFCVHPVHPLSKPYFGMYIAYHKSSKISHGEIAEFLVWFSIYFSKRDL